MKFSVLFQPSKQCIQDEPVEQVLVSPKSLHFLTVCFSFSVSCNFGRRCILQEHPCTCEGPNDLVAEWPTEEELKTFNETTEGKQPLVSVFSIPASGLTIYLSRFHSNLLK